MTRASRASRVSRASRAGPASARRGSAGQGVQAFARTLQFGIEAGWLLAVIAVPLLVLPEESFISFTSVPKIATLRVLAGAVLILMVLRWAIAPGFGAGGAGEDSTLISRAWRSLAGTPSRATIAGMIAVLVATALSAAAAISPYHGVFGKDPGSDGYDLYTVACYVVLGFSVATNLRRREQLWRLLAVVSGVGTLAALVAVLQNYGFSPLDISGTSGVRVTGTAGNPIFLGSLLVMTLPVSAAALAAYGGAAGFRLRWWALAIPVGGLQVAALSFTLSRGPWLGAACAVLTFAVLVLFLAGRRPALVLACFLAGALVLALGALSAPGWLRSAGDGASGGVSGRVADSVSTGQVVSRAATVDEEIGQGLSGRIDRWETSLELAATRPPIPEGNDPGLFVRSLFGYGPDMFRFAFPLRAPSELSTVRTDAAHNDHLNRLVEIGIIGSLTYFALGAAVVAVLIQLVRGAKRSGDASAGFVAAGLAAALAGRVVEQSFGIAKPGDLTVEWILIGLVAAAPRVLLAETGSGDQGAVASTSRGAKGRTGSVPAAAIAIPVVAAAAIAAVLFVTWTKGVNYLRADNVARQTGQTFTSDPAAGLRQIETAISLAPDVRDYHHRESLMLQAVADVDESRSARLLREAAAADLHAVDLNPMSIDSNLAAGFSAWRVAQLGDAEMALKTLVIYERLARLTPQNPLVLSRLDALRTSVQFTPVDGSK